MSRQVDHGNDVDVEQGQGERQPLINQSQGTTTNPATSGPKRGGLQQTTWLGMGFLEPLQYLCTCSWIWSSVADDRYPDSKPPLARQASGNSTTTTTTIASQDNEELQETSSSSSSIYMDTATIVKYVKYAYSCALLGFCVYLAVAGMFAHATMVARLTNPWVSLIATCAFIVWLGLLEGGQGCLVGLQPLDATTYQESHPITYQCARLAHTGDNLNRFIVGRQFLVVLVVFCLNLCCTVMPPPPSDPVGLAEDKHADESNHAIHVLMESGLAVMLITVMLGQLSAEVNATHCMLDFINTPCMWVTTWFCLLVEASGLLHSVYLVQSFFPKTPTTNTTALEDQEPKRSMGERFFYWARVLLSLGLVGVALAVTLTALLGNETTAGKGGVTSVFIFFGLVCFLGILEAVQIALFAVVNMPPEENPIQSQCTSASAVTARANCQLAFDHPRNFQAILIGRQICVTICMFLLARLTTTEVDADGPMSSPSRDVWGMSRGLQDFFNTGLPGALLTTVVASLAWRIMASAYPVAFLGNPVVSWTLRLCLALEAGGLFSASWLLADGVRRAAGLQSDDVYILSSKDCSDKTVEGSHDSLAELAPVAYGATAA